MRNWCAQLENVFRPPDNLITPLHAVDVSDLVPTKGELERPRLSFWEMESEHQG